MSEVLLKAAAFILIILFSFVLKKIGILRAEDLPVFSKLVVKITLPAAIVSNFSKITMEPSMLVIVALGLLCSGFYVAVGYGLFFNGTREEKAFGLLNVSGYNIGCFTMPFIQNFLGPAGVAATSLFDAGNAMICTGTSYAIAVAVSGKGQVKGPAQMVKQLFSSVPFDCYIIMTVLALLHLKLPALVTSFAETIGNANTFLSLFMIGLGLEIHVSKKQVSAISRLLLARYAVAFVLSFLLYMFAPFGDEVRRALAILMFGPVSSLGVAYTSMIDGDVNQASSFNSLSILISIACLTVSILIL